MLLGKVKRRAAALMWAPAAALFLFAVIPFLAAPVPVGHDTYYHISRLLNIAAEMKNGNPFPRIYSFGVGGLGYGAPLFYSDLFLYPFALLNALGMPVIAACKVMFCAILAAVYLSMYGSAGSILRNRTQAHVAALTYAFSFYCMTDFFQRGAIGECLGFALLPVVYLGYHDIVHGREHRWWILSLGMAGLLFSHTLSALIAAMLLVVLMLSDAGFWLKNLKHLRYPVMSAVLCCGISCCFWLPMLEQMGQLTLKLDDDLGGVQTFLRSLYTPVRLLAPPSVMALLSPGSELALPRLTGLFGYIAAAICALAAWRSHRRNVLKPLIVSLVFVWLCGRWSPTQLLAKYLAVLQFPWRLMLPAALMLAVFAGLGYGCIRSRKIRTAMLVLTMLSGATAILISYPAAQYAQLSRTAEARGVTEAELMRTYTSVDFVSGAQYLPAELPYNFVAPEVTAKASVESIRFEMTRDERNRMQVVFSGNPGGATLDLPLILYIGYEAEADDGRLLDISRGELGMVRVNLGDAESGSFTVRYAGTTLQHIADGITIFSALAFAVFLLRRYRRA